MMQWFFRQYRRPGDRDMRLTPLQGNLQGLPPATVILAEIDPLRTEGEQYAERLRAAGVPVAVELYPRRDPRVLRHGRGRGQGQAGPAVCRAGASPRLRQLIGDAAGWIVGRTGSGSSGPLFVSSLVVVSPRRCVCSVFRSSLPRSCC